MMDKLLIQIEIQKALYLRLHSEGRTDAVACIVLSRIEQQINALKERYATEKARQESFKPQYTHRITCYVWKALHRFKHHYDRGHRTIFGVPTENLLQAQADTK